MTEQLLQFIWQHRYFHLSALETTAGEPLEIIHQGTHNSNQGPDFFNAKIKCGGTIFAGSIEIHVKASEWEEHRHSSDKNYNNVILHVVLEEDKKLRLDFPVLELRDRVSNMMLSKYEDMMRAQHFIPCEKHIGQQNSIAVIAWKERLLIERLQEKADRIRIILEKNNCDWENSFWQSLAKNFGGKINGDAFECMAASLPVNILAKHKTSLHQLEALLLGQCGLLQNDFIDDYPKMLQKEFRFLKNKYSLPGAHIPVHFLRMRPANFPTVRLAQLAMLIHESSHLFSRVKEAAGLKEAARMFVVTANDYWHYRYSFDDVSPFKKKALGDQMIQNILVNTVLPMLFAYGWYNSADAYKEKALRWAEELKPEKNSITAGFEQLGMENRFAADSQALIQLKNNYCNEKKCLQCAVGNAILKTGFRK